MPKSSSIILSHPPITEAVIEIRTAPASDLDEKTVREYFRSEVAEYSFDGNLGLIEFPTTPMSPVKDLGWQGDRFKSPDGKYIIQFKKNGMTLSRLEPYPNWNEFSAKGMDFWGKYQALFNPEIIKRLGVRFINSILLEDRKLSDIIKKAPDTSYLSLKIEGYLHQEACLKFGSPYGINIINTLQRASGGPTVILDIDAYLLNETGVKSGEIAKHLQALRELKNHVFFSMITKRTKERFV